MYLKSEQTTRWTLRLKQLRCKEVEFLPHCSADGSVDTRVVSQHNNGDHRFVSGERKVSNKHTQHILHFNTPPDFHTTITSFQNTYIIRLVLKMVKPRRFDERSVEGDYVTFLLQSYCSA